MKVPVAAALALFCAAALFVPRDASPQEKKKTATLSGTIYRGEKQHPVANALIVLTTEQKVRDERIPIRLEARSDASGAYRFDDLIGSKYQVTIRTVFQSAEEVPCKLRPARSKDPDSIVTVAEEDGKHVEQLLITHFPVKSGKPMVKDFDLECLSVFSRE